MRPSSASPSASSTTKLPRTAAPDLCPPAQPADEARLLQETLDEEGRADRRLTEIAEAHINDDARSESDLHEPDADRPAALRADRDCSNASRRPARRSPIRNEADDELGTLDGLVADAESGRRRATRSSTAAACSRAGAICCRSTCCASTSGPRAARRPRRDVARPLSGVRPRRIPGDDRGAIAADTRRGCCEFFPRDAGEPGQGGSGRGAAGMVDDGCLGDGAAADAPNVSVRTRAASRTSSCRTASSGGAGRGTAAGPWRGTPTTPSARRQRSGSVNGGDLRRPPGGRFRPRRSCSPAT